MTSGKDGHALFSLKHKRKVTCKPLERPAMYAHIFSSTSLPTCLVHVYGYAASTTQWTHKQAGSLDQRKKKKKSP